MQVSIDSRTIALIVFISAALIFSGAFLFAVIKERFEKNHNTKSTQ
jgi:Flp pilus assembly pilin Flp